MYKCLFENQYMNPQIDRNNKYKLGMLFNLPKI